MKTLDLDRFFIPVSDKDSNQWEVSLLLAELKGLQWPDLLQRKRVAVLAEARSGKTLEFKRRAEIIDNNVLENDIRPIAVGKRNWLFAGSERAGKRAAAIQSLLGTARLNGIEPAAWLKDTLEKISAWPNRRIDELLPLEPSSCPAH